MTNSTLIACTVLVGSLFTTAEAQYPYASGPVYAVPTASVTTATYANNQTRFTNIRVMPYRGVTPVRTIPATSAENAYRLPEVIRTARATRPVSTQEEQARQQELRQSPFRGRQGILDSRLTTGNVIR